MRNFFSVEKGGKVSTTTHQRAARAEGRGDRRARRRVQRAVAQPRGAVGALLRRGRRGGRRARRGARPRRRRSSRLGSSLSAFPFAVTAGGPSSFVAVGVVGVGVGGVGGGGDPEGLGELAPYPPEERGVGSGEAAVISSFSERNRRGRRRRRRPSRGRRSGVPGLDAAAAAALALSPAAALLGPALPRAEPPQERALRPGLEGMNRQGPRREGDRSRGGGRGRGRRRRRWDSPPPRRRRRRQQRRRRRRGLKGFFLFFLAVVVVLGFFLDFGGRHEVERGRQRDAPLSRAKELAGAEGGHGRRYEEAVRVFQRK